MGTSLSLNGTWGLTYGEGNPQVVPDHYTGPTVTGRRLFPAAVPGPIHKALMELGLVDDPNLGLNSLRARWVEEMWWIYRHTFQAPAEACTGRAWLVFDRIELDADIRLNGEPLGRHANALRPARFEVTGKLAEGDNLLVVKLDAGLHGSSEKSADDYIIGPGIEQITKRHWHRNPQHQSGWDWHPRLLNVGILGDVRLEWHAGPRLGQVVAFAVLSEDLSTATLHVRAFVDAAEEGAATLRVRLVETGQDVVVPITLPAGDSRHEATFELTSPRLWWPLGHGEQYRYTVELTLETEQETQTATRRVGVRRVEMDQSPHPEQGRYCLLKVNNRPIFCKGGNWVPADIFYSTVDEARYRELVDLAVQANFNMLRIWGGGLYAEHPLLEACDEVGMLVWHDFIFACAKYPGDDPAFLAEVRKEITHTVRELAHHPSLVVWCGNNEIEWGDCAWGYETHGKVAPHTALFHRYFPQILGAEDPATFYWISSPWSPACEHPNDPHCGDQHPWNVSLGGTGAPDWWEYRTYVDRFPNEGGVLGASSPATLRQFLPEQERYLRSPSWEHHDNPFAVSDYVQGAPGHSYSGVELWTGRDPMAMEWEEYAFTSGLLQAEALTEYISNYRRRMFSSASAIFWMYNDSWPVTHGWTIVDYYRRKKLAYHPVRRAFAPVTVVVTDEQDEVVVYGVNDTPQEWRGELRYGLFLLAGNRPLDEELAVTLPANSSTALARFPRSEWQALGTTRSGAFAVLSQSGAPVAQYRLFVERFGELEFVEPEIEMRREGDELVLISDAFAWGVCLDVDGEAKVADNCFDLLPGIPHRVAWAEELGEPEIVAVGSLDAVAPKVGRSLPE